MPYLIYLRKSRADAEAEAHGEGETLARHEKTLLELANRMKLSVGDIYREIVSGESIAARPMMQRLLADVEARKWEGVLVMEVERLARGNSIDQGIVMQAFKYSGTKVITPAKTYNPNDEFDEQFFEFSLFMSRQEYKTISRRMQMGREASAREGKFVSNIAPYGYQRVKLTGQKGWTLAPTEEHADVVRMIFDLYVNGMDRQSGEKRRLGYDAISRHLNNLGIPPARGDYWRTSSVRGVLINPTYTGKIVYGRRPETYRIEDGKKVKVRASFNENCIEVEGLHPAIIDQDIFDQAQRIMAEMRKPPSHYSKELLNPLAGIIVCGKCGRRMRLSHPSKKRKYGEFYIICPINACDNVAVKYHLIEERLLTALREWLSGYKVELRDLHSGGSTASLELLRRSLKKIDDDISTLEKQMSSTHDLLEQGAYSVEVFLSRSRELSARINAAHEKRAVVEESMRLAQEQTRLRRLIVPTAERLLETYHDLPTPSAKNELLKEVIEKAVYIKDERGRKGNPKPENFDLVLYPRIERK